LAANPCAEVNVRSVVMASVYISLVLGADWTSEWSLMQADCVVPFQRTEAVKGPFRGFLKGMIDDERLFVGKARSQVFVAILVEHRLEQRCAWRPRLVTGGSSDRRSDAVDKEFINE
jgi:hypothetical protein